MRPRTFNGPIRWDAWNDVRKGHRKEISNVGRYENIHNNAIYNQNAILCAMNMQHKWKHKIHTNSYAKVMHNS